MCGLFRQQTVVKIYKRIDVSQITNLVVDMQSVERSRNSIVFSCTHKYNRVAVTLNLMQATRNHLFVCFHHQQSCKIHKYLW